MRFFDMFFGFNHPIYREVEYNELRERAIEPEFIKLLKVQNHTLLTKDNSNGTNHEDGDYCLEEKIKIMKKLSPKAQSSDTM